MIFAPLAFDKTRAFLLATISSVKVFFEDAAVNVVDDAAALCLTEGAAFGVDVDDELGVEVGVEAATGTGTVLKKGEKSSTKVFSHASIPEKAFSYESIRVMITGCQIELLL